METPFSSCRSCTICSFCLAGIQVQNHLDLYGDWQGLYPPTSILSFSNSITLSLGPGRIGIFFCCQGCCSMWGIL